MRSPSSEDEERSTTGAFSEDPPRSSTGEQGQHEETSDGDFSDDGDPDGADVESWHRLVIDSPLWRESECAWCLFYPPLLASREQER
jgi:hypothetical protein